jgi:hypothetical protein
MSTLQQGNPPVEAAVQPRQRVQRVRDDSLPPEITEMPISDLLVKLQIVQELNPNKNDKEYPGLNSVAKSIKYIKRTTSETTNLEGQLVQSVHLEEVTLDLNALLLEKVRKLCTHLGIKSVSSTPKYRCRMLLAQRTLHEEIYEKSTVVDTSNKEEKNKNSIMRLANTIFHSSVVNDVLTINDKKERIHHETGKTEKKIYVDCVDLYNSIELDDELDGIMQYPEKEALDPSRYHLNDDQITNADPTNFIPIADSDAFKSKVKVLFQIRKKVKADMGQSGTHESDPYDFIVNAKKNVPGGKSLSTYGIYYFYMRCDEYPGIDSKFSPTMPPALKGSSVDPSSWTEDDKNKRKRKTDNPVADAVAGMAAVFQENLDREKKKDDRKFLMELLQSNILSPDSKTEFKKKLLGSLSNESTQNCYPKRTTKKTRVPRQPVTKTPDDSDDEEDDILAELSDD